MLRTLQKILVIILLIVLAGYLSFQGFLYYRSRDKMPPGMTVAGVPAKVVGDAGCAHPSTEMKQTLDNGC